MSIDEQPMNVYWSGQKSPTSNKYKINHKGTVATASILPTIGNKKGDTYNISEDGSDYIWTGTEWDKFGANVYIGATDTANGIQGLVPSASSSQIYNLLTGGGTWETAENLGLALDSKVVHLTSNENITGVKTFNDALRPLSGILKNGNSGILLLCGGSTSEFASGAKLMLCGGSYAASPGIFTIDTGGTAKRSLIGSPDGTLSWNGQEIQTASDERIKTSLAVVPDEVLDAWGDVQWGQFQYLDAVASKGKFARLHLGLIAQKIKAVFEARGLDACAYGILCHEEREVTEDSETTDLWMVRYAEAQAMEAAYQRRRADRLEIRIAVIEEMLK